MKKNYQTTGAAAPINALVMPEAVTLAMSELTGAVKEGLLALAVGVGLQVLHVLMEEDVTAVAGPKGRHDRGPGRQAARDRGRFGHARGAASAGPSSPGPQRGRCPGDLRPGLRSVQWH